ncbi:3-hydroxyacyl-CoA dehydrogenase family protein [uncultured Tateyamaria sp.]|uniref:3-hydroxyacyl-CoA dehydrogenase family protein n=1 Tax=uncultured Tateyamaria sp. TaxID=455651 RepID=UPI002612747D|nr:3-hydroxyacyl-CoA dehydrogenase family protein [uncultured Tateyamaria sp.]
MTLLAAIHPMQDMFWRACEQVILRHSNPWELDDALTDWGYRIGPCAAQDLIGLDVVLDARGQGAHPTPVLARMVAEGRLGKRVGWGFYRYPGGGGAVVDPLIEDLVREEAWFAKLPRDELEGAALVDVLHAEIADQLRSDPRGAAACLGFPAYKAMSL